MPRASAVWTALGLVYVIWGSTYLGLAVAGESMPAFPAIGARFVLAGAILALIVVWRSGWRALRLTVREAASTALVGGLLAGSNALVLLGERTVPTGLAALIFCTVPLTVTALRIATGERPHPVALAGIAAGFCGVAILLNPEGRATWGGLALIVIAGLGWAVGSFLVPYLAMPANALATTAWQALLGGALLLPVAATRDVDLDAVTTRSWLGFAYLVVVGSLIGFTAYSWLLGHAPIGLVATYAFVNPVVAILLGILLYNESLSLRTLIGAVITLGAVAVVVRREATDARAPRTAGAAR